MKNYNHQDHLNQSTNNLLIQNREFLYRLSDYLRECTPKQRKVFWKIYDQVQKWGRNRAYVSQSTIASWIPYTRSYTNQIIRRFVKQGFILSTFRSQKTCKYNLPEILIKLKKGCLLKALSIARSRAYCEQQSEQQSEHDFKLYKEHKSSTKEAQEFNIDSYLFRLQKQKGFSDEIKMSLKTKYLEHARSIKTPKGWIFNELENQRIRESALKAPQEPKYSSPELEKALSRLGAKLRLKGFDYLTGQNHFELCYWNETLGLEKVSVKKDLKMDAFWDLHNNMREKYA